MLMPPKFDTNQWAQDNFHGCPLGDERRGKRLETFAGQVVNRPAASLPKIGEDWGGTRGIYRLLDRPEATLASVTQTHRDRTRQQTGQFVIVSDTTHVDFGGHRDLPDAGPISAGSGQGFLLHSGLLIDPVEGSLIGLAGQVAHVRPEKRKGRQNDSQRLSRWRESEMWVELFEQVGCAPEDSQYIHVCDSAADNFEVFCTAKQLHCDFVIRAGRMHRKVVADGRTMPLSEAMSGLEELGRYDLELPRRGGFPGRTASLRVSARAIELPLPRHPSQRVKQYRTSGEDEIQAWGIVVEEINPPDDVEPIHWVLLTTIPIESFDDAWMVLNWYEDRWLVEEWHKALKTGCRLEARQLQSTDRLLPLVGVLSVVAILLVQLKSAARMNPTGRASQLVPTLWLKLLQAKGKIRTRNITNYEFWRAVAKLGGFLGRRRDGEPGWQLIWRGWKELHTLAEGAELSRKCG